MTNVEVHANTKPSAAAHTAEVWNGLSSHWDRTVVHVRLVESSVRSFSPETTSTTPGVAAAPARGAVAMLAMRLARESAAGGCGGVGGGASAAPCGPGDM